jgi:hypothetical protein
MSIDTGADRRQGRCCRPTAELGGIDMRYLLLIYSNPTAWETWTEEESSAMHAEYGAFTKEIVDSGEFVGGDALTSPDTGTTVRVRDGHSSATDGPYAETKEHLAGYYAVDVASLDRAKELAAKIPDARFGSIEIRPIMDVGTPAA